MTITAYSQRDPRWAHDGLGDSPSLTIGEAGCLITCVASMLTDWGVNTDPGRLNRWLRTHGGYQNDCLFRFYSVAGLGADLVQHVRCPRTPAPIAGINTSLATDRAVIAEVDNHPGPPHSAHWIRLLGPVGQDSRDYHIMDPWRQPGAELTTLLAGYALPGWDAARVITAVAIYQHNTARVISFPTAAGAAGPTQTSHGIYPSPDIGGAP